MTPIGEEVVDSILSGEMDDDTVAITEAIRLRQMTLSQRSKQRWTLTVDLDGGPLSWAEETELIQAIEAVPRVVGSTLKREFVT